MHGNPHVKPATVLEAVEGSRARPSPAARKPYVSVSADVVVAGDEAAARELAAGYGLYTQFVGSPQQVAGQLEILQEATGADELIITTITHDHADRVRSYELLAREWQRR